MNGRLGALVALQVLSATCATTAPPVSLIADAPDMIWSAGSEIMHAEQGGVSVAAAAADSQNGWLAVRVQVDNQSDEILTVDPAQMYYRTCPLRHSGPRDIDCSVHKAVADPEHLLFERDRPGAAERTAKAFAVAIGTALLLSFAVALVTSRRHHAYPIVIVDGGGDEDPERRPPTAGEASRRDMVAQALHRTTLSPGRAIAGLVYLPVDREARSLRFFLPVADRHFRFPFQLAVRERSERTRLPANLVHRRADPYGIRP